ncbi:MAG TPA: adenylyl-sulfate kinase, partial [Alteromonas australica]|nr:adenylyl-sulfate kinase [Alteromonas australica]
SGKSTLANLLEKKLPGQNKHPYLLDGDNVRHGLCGDLGFSDKDRVENIRRISEVAKLFVDAGTLVLTAFISPFKADRDYCRSLLEEGEFVEVFIDTPLEVCESRDPKGLYKKARSGEIKDFTGIDSAYEAPEAPEIHLTYQDEPAEQTVERLYALLQEKGLV